ncbi:MAG: hypothetical protein RCG15_02130 [Candidatus Rickettsia vulgarisii]
MNELFNKSPSTQSLKINELPKNLEVGDNIILTIDCSKSDGIALPSTMKIGKESTVVFQCKNQKSHRINNYDKLSL